MRNILFPIFTILSAALFILSLGTIAPNSQLADSFYNADSLFFPILYSEIFLREGILGLYGFTDWCWTPSTYFLPDAFFYFGLRTLFLFLDVGAWEYTHLTYAVVQWTYLLFGILFLIRIVGIGKKNLKAEYLFLGLGYLFGAACILEQSRIFLFCPDIIPALGRPLVGPGAFIIYGNVHGKESISWLVSYLRSYSD